MKICAASWILSALVLSGCGGGSGGSDPHVLSKYPAIRMLFNKIDDAMQKSDFESTAEYDQRIENFRSGLVGFHATIPMRTSYDADTQEFRIGSINININEGKWEYDVAFNNDYSQLWQRNINDLYEGPTRQEQFGNTTYNNEYFDIFTVPSDEAQRLINAYVVDIYYSFTRENLDAAEYRCISANFTNCSHNVEATVDGIKVRNTVTGESYGFMPEGFSPS